MKRRERKYRRRMLIRHICPNWIWYAWVLEEPIISALKVEIKGKVIKNDNKNTI